jgi:cell wall-associated NlpC family hydrolase
MLMITGLFITSLSASVPKYQDKNIIIKVHKGSVDAKIKKTKKSKETKKSKTMAKSKVIRTARKYLGTRYRWGGCSTHGFDCSGFVKYVYSKHGKKLPRTSREMASVGKHVSKKSLKTGDLIFFSSKRTRGIAHVAIYINNGKFIHASSGKHKVVITKLSSKYYARHYKGARRL